jgi:hypothetical protein
MLDQRLVDMYNKLKAKGYLRYDFDLEDVNEHQLAELMTNSIQGMRTGIESIDEIQAKHLIDYDEMDCEVEAKELLRDLTDMMNSYLEDHGDEY